ncbi:MAG: FitA-like ribbon-helix-helix domain-containing protein [Leptospirales bacterium]
MPSITLKNIPEPLYRRLLEIARNHHRSLSKELLVAIENYSRLPDHSKEGQLERIRLVRNQYRHSITDKDIADWKDAHRP